MRSRYKKLGPYIQEVDQKNTDLSVTRLLGVSVSKEFIPSIANTIGTNMATYKIVCQRQFAYGPVTSRNSDKVSIALLKEDQCIVSTSYTVFEIIDQEALLPEYLMMWFRRPEFDRYARFMSHGSVRELFGWEEMSDVELPIPSIEKQQEIVKEYHTILERINLNDRLIQKLEEIAQTIYKQWFEDFEFPISAEYAAVIDEPELEGQPYKSIGGEMVFSEILEKMIPKGWERNELKHLAQIKGGKRLPTTELLIADPTPHPYIKVADMGRSKFVCLNKNFDYLTAAVQKQISRYIVHTEDLIISIVGTIGTVSIIDNSLNGANLTENCARISELKKVTTDYLYHFFYSKRGREEIEMRTVGGVQGKLPLYNIGALEMLIPKEPEIARFSAVVSPINQSILSAIKEADCLAKMLDVLFARISRLQ